MKQTRKRRKLGDQERGQWNDPDENEGLQEQGTVTWLERLACSWIQTQSEELQLSVNSQGRESRRKGGQWARTGKTGSASWVEEENGGKEFSLGH